MPFILDVQRTIVIDIRQSCTTVYVANAKQVDPPKKYDQPCSAFKNGFMANAAEFVKHAIQYAKTVEIGPEDILVVIIPPNAGRQAKLYFVNQLFLGTTANMIRLEYRCSFELYALQQ